MSKPWRCSECGRGLGYHIAFWTLMAITPFWLISCIISLYHLSQLRPLP
jgi:hypothetical protein